MLSRRTMLRGIGGAALALPFLESMLPRTARAGGQAAIPTRYVFCYAGTSTGRYLTETEGKILEPSTFGALTDVGADMHSLQPLVTEGVLGDVSLVSNLLVPWGTNANDLPAGGRLVELDFHGGPSVTPQLSGRKALELGRMDGASSDQLLVEQMLPDTVFPSLSYRVQPVSYLGGDGGTQGRVAFRNDGESVVAIDPLVSPQLAYQTLFSSFTPPEASPEQLAAMQRRISVLDRVGEATRSLLPTLGAADRQRLERHLHEVEQLEAQLSATPPGVSAQCEVLADPGADPPIGGLHDGLDEIGSAAGWSDESHRASVLTDLVRMALTCDLTRYATLQYTMWKSWMSAYQLGAGWDMDIHQVGHTHVVPREAMGDVVAWHVGHFARLVRLLKETPEYDGSSVLDHTVLVLCFEGGHGVDPTDGSYSTHSTENMSVIVAGRGGGLQPGQHIDGARRHPAQATLSAMRAAGYAGNFGDFAEGIEELYG
jgi:hypothetical protein